jgi:hypothetical protein
MSEHALVSLPVVVSEYPKSGGSWIVSMLGEALRLPCRDIYVQPGFDLFEIGKHPWYRDAQVLDIPELCVIKSHEMSGSAAIAFPALEVHLVRDGRDVAVSKYFFERDFCVRNGITKSFDKSFDSFVEQSAKEWADYVLAWHARPEAIAVSYEAFVSDSAFQLCGLFQRITGATLERELSDRIVEKYSLSNFSASLSPAFKHNTFVRKGVIGDWKNHFSDHNREAFESIAGEALRKFGYRMDGSDE